MKKTLKRVQAKNEFRARRAVLEDLFYDFSSSRARVYWMNFTRGIFFGIGSVLGGTLVIGAVLWLLGQLSGLPGGIGDFINYIVQTVQAGPPN